MNIQLPYEDQFKECFNRQDLCSLLLSTPSEVLQKKFVYKIMNEALEEEDVFIKKREILSNIILNDKKKYISSNGLLLTDCIDKETLEYKTLFNMLAGAKKNDFEKISQKWKREGVNSNNGLLLQNNFSNLSYLVSKIGNSIFPEIKIYDYQKDSDDNYKIKALKEEKAILIVSNMFKNIDVDKNKIMINAKEKTTIMNINNSKSMSYIYNNIFKGVEYSYNLDNALRVTDLLKNDSLKKVIVNISPLYFSHEISDNILDFYSKKDKDLKELLSYNSDLMESNDIVKRSLGFINYSIINSTLLDINRNEKVEKINNKFFPDLSINIKSKIQI